MNQFEDYGFKLMTPCTNCPCLNIDRERGGSCNLRYDTDLYWQPDCQLIDASENCQLMEVVTEPPLFKKQEKVWARKERVHTKLE